MLKFFNDFVPFIIFFFFAAVLGIIAYGKNLNPWAWGLIGVWVFIPALLLLLVKAPRCPACHQELSIAEMRAGACKKCAATFHFRYSGKLSEHRGAIVLGLLVTIIAGLLIYNKYR